MPQLLPRHVLIVHQEVGVDCVAGKLGIIVYLNALELMTYKYS